VSGICSGEISVEATDDSTDENILIDIHYGADLNGDGYDDLKVVLAIDEASNSGTEDMIGVAFDLFETGTFPVGMAIDDIFIAPDTLGQFQTAAAATWFIKPNGIPDLVCPGFNVEGGAVGIVSPFDAAVNFEGATQGCGGGGGGRHRLAGPGGGGGGGNSGSISVQRAQFVITSNSTHVDASALDNSHWYIRLQKTNGPEDGGAKLVGFVANVNPCSFDETTSVSEAPTSEPPTSEGPSSQQPSSAPPSSEAPTSESPTSSLPTSDSPTSSLPTSESPTSSLPTSSRPTSYLPTSNVPSSEFPTSDAPSSALPTSNTPTSSLPTSDHPTSNFPSSELPTSDTPTSELPSSDTPTSAIPTSEVPSTGPPSEICVGQLDNFIDGGSQETIIVSFEFSRDFTGDGLDDIRVCIVLDPADDSGSEDIVGLSHGALVGLCVRAGPNHAHQLAHTHPFPPSQIYLKDLLISIPQPLLMWKLQQIKLILSFQSPLIPLLLEKMLLMMQILLVYRAPIP